MRGHEWRYKEKDYEDLEDIGAEIKVYNDFTKHNIDIKEILEQENILEYKGLLHFFFVAGFHRGVSWNKARNDSIYEQEKHQSNK